MTNDLKSRLSTTAKVISNLMIIGTALSTCLMLLATTGVFLFGEMIRREAHEFLGLDALATKADVDRLEEQILEATGQNQIFYMVPGHSYIEEPVFIGDTLRAHIVAQRTAKGRDCIYKTGRAVFTGIRGIPIPGQTLPATTQLGVEAQPILLDLDVPDKLLPGRIMLSLALQYDCADRTVFEDSDPLFFYLKEAP